MADSTKRRPVRKQASGDPSNWRIALGLHPDFPLFIHWADRANKVGRWAKKVHGKIYYFGNYADDTSGQRALAEWLRVKDARIAGREPRPAADCVTVKDVVNEFYNDKRRLVESGELSPRTLDEYATTGKMIASHFGTRRAVSDLGPDDFKGLRAAMAKKWGPVRLGNEIQRVRMIFRNAEEILEKPVQFGKSFHKPSAKVIRLNRAERGPRDLAAADIQSLANSASPNMRAMILLGINGGLGPTDLGLLKMRALDLDGGWLDYPRVKTGVPRKVPLWPETVAAIRDVIAKRREPLTDDNVDLLFISPRGYSYLRDTSGKDGSQRGARAYGLSQEFKFARRKAQLTKPTFYDLRRTFQTVAEGAHDLSAVQAIMGHAPNVNDMSALYRQRVSDERLLAVTEHVRHWLFGQTISTKSAD